MTTKAYDDLVERLRREREGKRIPDGIYMGPKTALTVSTIPKEALNAVCHAVGQLSAPTRKRGRPKGSRNKSK